MALTETTATGASPIEADYQRGVIMLVPMEAIVTLLRRADSIGRWGAPIVSCCLVENGMNEESLGVARRCVVPPLKQPPSSGTNNEVIVRETLVAAKILPSKAFFTFTLTAGGACDDVPAVDLVTTITISPIAGVVTTATYPDASSSSAPSSTSMGQGHRCFVDWYSTFAARSAEDLATVQHFLRYRWAEPLLERLSDFVLNVASPNPHDGRPGDNVSLTILPQYRSLYGTFESTLIALSADGRVPESSVQNVDTMLKAWYDQCKEVVARDILVDTLRHELVSRQSVIGDLTRQVASLHEEIYRLQSEVLRTKARLGEPASMPPEMVPPMVVHHHHHHPCMTPEEQQAGTNPMALPLPPPRGQPVAEITEGPMKAVKAAPGGHTEHDSSTPRRDAAAEVRTPRGTKVAPPPSVEMYRAQFDALDTEHNGYLPFAVLVKLMSAADPRSDNDLHQEVLVSKVRGAALQASGQPWSRQWHFEGLAKAWVKKHCADAEAGVSLTEFAVLQCQFAKV